MFLKTIGLFIGVFVTASTASAQETSLESRFFKELTKQESGKVKQGTVAAKSAFSSEISDGLSNSEIIPTCDPKRFEESVVDSKLTTQQYYDRVKDYFKKCSTPLLQNSSLGIFSLLKFSNYKYSIFSHPQIKSFTVTLDNGVKVPAILAMKEGNRPRPMVVVRCGVFCAAEGSPSIRSYLMQLFDQSPFHVLFLANQTGIDYIALNKYFTMGGWSEGYESVEVGRWMLERWEHRKLISSMHLMGISLGGNAAVMGAAFNDQYPRASGAPVFSSVAAICPVVSLKPTLDELYGSSIVGRIFNGMTVDQLKEARKYVKDIPDMLDDRLIPDRKSMSNYIGEMASTSLQRRGVASTSTDFFKYNNFFNVRRTVATPMLVWASKDDMVVNNKVNAAILDSDVNIVGSKNTSVLNLGYGNHCAFNAAYGAAAAATVLRTFVLNHSPEFLPEYRKQKMELSMGYKKLPNLYMHVAQTFEFAKDSSQVKVKFRYFNWRTEQCYYAGPWGGLNSCLETREYKVPVSSLKAMGAKVPRSTAEAQAMGREFNTKVEFRTKDGPLNGTSSNEFHLVWRGGFE